MVNNDYELCIPFDLISYPPNRPEIELGKFEINHLQLELTKDNKHYHLCVKNFKDDEEKELFIQNFELFLKYYSLGREYCAVDIVEFEAIRIASIEITETLTRFEDELNLIINNEYELNDDLKLCLDIFSKHAQYNYKTQFLDLITILEIIKEEIPVSEASEEAITDIKKSLKKIRKRFDNKSEEYKEFDRYFQDIEYWHNKSINSSLKLFADKHKDEFKEYENIEELIRKAYDIRSVITHQGKIEDELEFENFYNFLRRFVAKLLKIMIDEKKIT